MLFFYTLALPVAVRLIPTSAITDAVFYGFLMTFCINVTHIFVPEHVYFVIFSRRRYMFSDTVLHSTQTYILTRLKNLIS
jgi:hypothetical protein